MGRSEDYDLATFIQTLDAIYQEWSEVAVSL